MAITLRSDRDARIFLVAALSPPNVALSYPHVPPCEGLPASRFALASKSEQIGCQPKFLLACCVGSTVTDPDLDTTQHCKSKKPVPTRGMVPMPWVSHISMLRSSTRGSFVPPHHQHRQLHGAASHSLPFNEAVPQPNRRHGSPPVRLDLRYCDDVWLP